MLFTQRSHICSTARPLDTLLLLPSLPPLLQILAQVISGRISLTPPGEAGSPCISHPTFPSWLLTQFVVMNSFVALTNNGSPNSGPCNDKKNVYSACECIPSIQRSAILCEGMHPRRGISHTALPQNQLVRCDRPGLPGSCHPRDSWASSLPPCSELSPSFLNYMVGSWGPQLPALAPP